MRSALSEKGGDYSWPFFISAFDIRLIVNLMFQAYLGRMAKQSPLSTTGLKRRPSLLHAVVVNALLALGGCANSALAAARELDTDSSLEEITMGRNVTALARRGEVMALTPDELVARLIRAGELQVSGEDQAELDSYFDTGKFRFHGPDGFEADYAGLANYFKSVRAAFDDRSIRRGVVVAEGNFIACQTWIEGRFVRQFAHSPAGTLLPNGQRVVWDLINIFRFDDRGRLVEEWVRTDNRSFLRQLGAQGQ
jgi:predicted ester cyclase